MQEEFKGRRSINEEQEPRSQNLSAALLKAIARQAAGVALSDEEAAVLGPQLQGFSAIIRSIQVDEEVEPALVFQCPHK